MILNGAGRLLMLLVLGAALVGCEASGGSGASSNLPQAQEGERGRAMSVQPVGGGGGGGGGNGPMLGGVAGGAIGSIIGAQVGGTLGSSLIGMLLGAIGGAIAGAIVSPSKPSGGIEIVVEKPDGQQVVVVQPDDGQVELGDMVQIVRDGRGVRAVRDTSQPQ